METTADSGAGEVGRIRIEYCEAITGVANPPASTQKLNCYVAEQVESAPFTTGRLNLPENVTGSKTYQVQYGRKLNFDRAVNQTTTLRIPAGMLTTATLDALVSQLPANASFALDIGADGVDDWSGTVANNSTNASPNLAAAFNAYWASHGAPTTGDLDVPVKVTLGQAGQVLLTNLQVTTAGSKLRSVRLPVQSYATVNLDFTVGGSGAGPLDRGAGRGRRRLHRLERQRRQPARRPQDRQPGRGGQRLPGRAERRSWMCPLRFHVAPDASVTLDDYTTTLTQVANPKANSIGPGVVLAAALDATAVAAGDPVPLAATLSNSGNLDTGPVTAAFFATAEGWGDWYIGSDFFANIPAGGSVPAEIIWDTTGFSGTTPVKVVVNPYGRVPESNPADNVATTSVFGRTAAAAARGQLRRRRPRAARSPSPCSSRTPTTSQAPITTWPWRFGDGATSSQQHPSHTYTQRASTRSPSR